MTLADLVNAVDCVLVAALDFRLVMEPFALRKPVVMMATRTLAVIVVPCEPVTILDDLPAVKSFVEKFSLFAYFCIPTER